VDKPAPGLGSMISFLLWLLGACLVIGFKHSFLCLNPKNGRPGSNLVCLALVLTFWIQIFSLFI
jgi:hypothetical protein